VVEGYGSSNIWGCYGATSPDLVTWTRLNSGNVLVATGAAGSWEQNGVANPKIMQLPDNSFVIQYNGSDTVGGSSPDDDWQHGYAISPSRGGPYSKLAVNPVVGKPQVSYGFETAHFSWDEDGKTYFNIGQRFATASNTASAYNLFAESRQGGLLLNRAVDFTDAAVAGCMLAAGSFKGEVRSVFLAHRTVTSALFPIALVNSATVPTPTTAAAFLAMRRLEITRNAHDSPTAGDVGLVYWDTGAVRHFWSGTAWGTTSVTIATDYAREIVAGIAYDSGLNIYYLTATYADDGSVIASATISGASVGSFGAGRALLTGDPYTDASIATMYLRSFIVRPYAATEPALTAGPQGMMAGAALTLASDVVIAAAGPTPSSAASVSFTLKGDTVGAFAGPSGATSAAAFVTLHDDTFAVHGIALPSGNVAPLVVPDYRRTTWVLG
jgi:hypothetical protein